MSSVATVPVISACDADGQGPSNESESPDKAPKLRRARSSSDAGRKLPDDEAKLKRGTSALSSSFRALRKSFRKDKEKDPKEKDAKERESKEKEKEKGKESKGKDRRESVDSTTIASTSADGEEPTTGLGWKEKFKSFQDSFKKKRKPVIASTKDSTYVPLEYSGLLEVSFR